MAPRTAWQAITLPPGRFLTTPWPWRCLAYLVSGVALGIVAVTSVGVVAAVGGALAVALIGSMSLTVAGLAVSAGAALTVALLASAVLATCVAAGIVVGRVERWRLRLVDFDPAPDPHVEPPEPGPRAWARTRLREAVTWRELAHTFISACAMWWIDFGVVALCVGGPAAAVVSFVTTPNVPLAWRATGVALVVLALPVAAYPVAAWAAARAQMTRSSLGDRDAELARRLDETTMSRARLVDAFEAEHRRIERDLHDGAQQRLVAVSVSVGLAKLDLDPASEAYWHLASAQEQARLALAELRELVRGIHPQVLTDRGLPAAVADVAGRSAVPVDVDLPALPRLPRAVESTAYFAVCEALVNVARHAHARSASVRGRFDDDVLVLEVADDGVGGADPAGGTGLTGLADRVSVVDGRLHVSSPPGGPTVLRVEIPCG